MLEILQHFAFEALMGGAGLALIGAGIAILSAPQGWLIANIPLVGRLVDSIKHGAATVLIAGGCALIAYAAGYAYRGTVEKQASLLDKIATQEAIKAERDRRDEAFATARAADAELADQLAAENAALRAQQRKDDEASRANDNRPGLGRDGVRRLNSIRRSGHSR